MLIFCIADEWVNPSPMRIVARIAVRSDVKYADLPTSSSRFVRCTLIDRDFGMPHSVPKVTPGVVSGGTPSTVRLVGAVGSEPMRGRFDPVWSFDLASTTEAAGFATKAPITTTPMSAALIASADGSRLTQAVPASTALTRARLSRPSGWIVLAPIVPK